MTDKLDLESMNIAKDKQDKLKALFPEVFSEGKIDFDRLRATLGDIGVSPPNRSKTLIRNFSPVQELGIKDFLAVFS